MRGGGGIMIGKKNNEEIKMAIHHDKHAYGNLEKLSKDMSESEIEKNLAELAAYAEEEEEKEEEGEKRDDN